MCIFPQGLSAGSTYSVYKGPFCFDKAVITRLVITNTTHMHLPDKMLFKNAVAD